MAHTMNATSILRSQRMYDPFKYSQLLEREKSRHLRMSHLEPALGHSNINQFICPPAPVPALVHKHRGTVG